MYDNQCVTFSAELKEGNCRCQTLPLALTFDESLSMHFVHAAVVKT